MAAEVCRSPVIVSPRKPLAALIPNVHGTPTKNLGGHKVNPSPFKMKVLSEATIAPPFPGVTVLPGEVARSSRKRAYEEMVESSQDDSLPRTQQTVGTSFSSLIDYNAQRSSPDTQVIQSDVTNTSVKARANILRLRLQMAFFRVQTNQLQVPLADLRLPDSKVEQFNPGEDKADADAEPKTPASSNRNRSSSQSSAVSEDELPPLPDSVLKAHDLEARRREVELTSSAVKGRAISGLLELSRG